jgi:hypothetical protein
MICCFFFQLGLKVDNAAIPACCILGNVNYLPFQKHCRNSGLIDLMSCTFSTTYVPYNWLFTHVYYTGSQDGFLQPFAAHTAWVLCPSRIPKNSREECTDSDQTRTQLEA